MSKKTIKNLIFHYNYNIYPVRNIIFTKIKKQNKVKNFFGANALVFFVFLMGLFTNGVFAFPVFASTTDGTIDLTYKYAWGENVGWINFGTTNGNVHVTDSGLSGYALGENIGWIYLGDITNDGEGNLSGYAWGENVGWIKFNPTKGGVVINSSGEFTGSALGENIGWIIFGGDYKVKTDWRPQSARPAPGGGGMPSQWYSPPAAPVEGFGVLINNNAEYTDALTTTLNLRGGSDTKRMAISNFADFRDAGQEAYQTTKSWNLCQGKESCPEGEYIVYVKFYTDWGTNSGVVSDKIIYRREKPIIEKISEEIEKIPEAIKKIPETINKIPEKIKEIFKPKPEEVVPKEIPIEELVPKEAPLALRAKWQLLSREPIKEFVLAPLPKAIRDLAQKFPEFGETLKKVGITKITDIEKLKAVKLTLPGLTESVGLPTAKVEPGPEGVASRPYGVNKFALPQGVPMAELSAASKQKIPTEIVFAKTGGELIDFNIVLSISDKGEPEQRISTISGKPLQLVVKPDQPVKSVKGYVVFKSKKPVTYNLKPETQRFQVSSFKFQDLSASLIFANPIFAKQQEKPVRVEEKLVLLEFEYTDPDGDGIYTAEIQAPVVEGEYEIITVMDFEDPELGKKEIRLTTVVDPEGYLYERDGNKETRIPGAIVSLFWLNPETKQYEIWPAKEYQQENPQTTDVRGTYSFLVPEGYYYLKAETPGYLVYDGKPFQVKEGSGIHVNIELKTKYWWLKIVDWKTILLIVVILLLLYNFYRDRIRERLLRKKV